MLKIIRLIFLIQLLFIRESLSNLIENEKANIDIRSDMNKVTNHERKLAVSEGDFNAESFGFPALTYNDMNSICEGKGQRICLSSEICDMSTRQVINPDLTSEFSVDNWIAVGDKQDEWLTLSRFDERYCKTHTEVAGAIPTWSSDLNIIYFKRLVKCCFVTGEPLFLSILF